MNDPFSFGTDVVDTAIEKTLSEVEKENKRKERKKKRIKLGNCCSIS